MSKVLIIKLGYSETVDQEISRTSSLGDVLRTTVLLHFYKNDNVTWLTDEKAVPLLINNPYIKRILIWDMATCLQLSREHFDIVVNLEKVPGLCALADIIFSQKRCKLYGFGFDVQTGAAVPNDGAELVYNICNNEDYKKKSSYVWQELLCSIINKEFNNEEYILGYQPKTKQLDRQIGFNYLVGNKWQTKAWLRNYWDALLFKLLKTNYYSSWQKGYTNLYDYIDWINQCAILVTNDSLGLHIALALKKQVIALFGPTNSAEIYGYGRMFTICTTFLCAPCFKNTCNQEISCMQTITVDSVFDEIKRIIK